MNNDIEVNYNLWVDIAEIIPKQFGGRDGKDNEAKKKDTQIFISSVLYLIQRKEPYSLRLNWKELPYQYGDINNHSHRFNEWRKKGIWEKLLPTLIKYNKWLLEEGKYEILMTNYKLIRDINKQSAKYMKNKNMLELEKLRLYQYINENLDRIEQILEDERIEKIFKTDRFWRNRRRRAKANSKNPRGAYWNKYPMGEYLDDPRNKVE